MPDGPDYSLQDVVDDGHVGAPPSENYTKCLDVLDNVVRECMFVSKSYGGIPSPTGKHFYASVLFTALITRSVSLLNLAPHSPWADKKIEHWDYSSLAGLVRTMIELRIAFYYLCTDECSSDEWNVRWNLFNLHDCTTRLRMFEALGNMVEAEQFSKEADELRQRLMSNLYFQSLPKKQHKKLLHGQTAYLFPLEEIAEKAGLEVNVFRWLYILLSSHVHGLPMSFYRIGGDPDRGRGLPSPIEESYSSLCLSLASSILTKTRDEVHRLFEGLGCKTEETFCSDATDTTAGDDLPIGGSMSTNLSDNLQLTFTKKTADLVETACHYLPSHALVLEREDSATAGPTLKWFDPLFWTVLINGEPATEEALEEATKGTFLFRVDPNERKILIKT